MSPQDVITWTRSLGKKFEVVAEVFIECGIDGDILGEIGKNLFW